MNLPKSLHRYAGRIADHSVEEGGIVVELGTAVSVEWWESKPKEPAMVTAAGMETL